MAVAPFLSKAFRAHAEREAMIAKKTLLVRIKCGLSYEVDLFDERIGHGIATNRDFITVYHDEVASAFVCLVVGVRIADVEGVVKAAICF